MSRAFTVAKGPRGRQGAGQGVVEYAGALVIATAVIALVLSLDPEESAAGIYSNIINSFSDYASEEVSNLDQHGG